MMKIKQSFEFMVNMCFVFGQEWEIVRYHTAIGYRIVRYPTDLGYRNVKYPTTLGYHKL